MKTTDFNKIFKSYIKVNNSSFGFNIIEDYINRINLSTNHPQ